MSAPPLTCLQEDSVHTTACKGLVLSDYTHRLLASLHEYCAGEGVGAEYMLLLLLVPARIVEEHRVLPQRLFQGLLSQIQGTSEYVDGAISDAFARDLCLYVKEVAGVSDPSTSLVENGVDILRGCFHLEDGVSGADCLRYMVQELHKKGALSDTDGVRAQVSASCVFSVHILSSAVVQSTVIDILRSHAKAEWRALAAGGRFSG